MNKHVFGAVLAATAFACATAQATTTYGNLDNFDAVNDTGQEAHGFEIDLEDVSSSDVLNVFGGPSRGFPANVERYGVPTITDYQSGGHHWVSIVYQSPQQAGAWTVGTPTGVFTSPGESCWTGGGIGYGPSTPCDHFGVSTSKNPTQTVYKWLVGGASSATPLTPVKSNVLAPVWNVQQQPGQAPVVNAQIQAPDALPGQQFGTAMWVQIKTITYQNQVGLYDLVDGNPVVANAETEVEWQLIQKEAGVAGSGQIESGGQEHQGDESVVRQYFFYAYAGAVDPQSGEAMPVNDSNPVNGDIGAFLGDQNAAVDFAGAPIGRAIPEPASWALLGIGFMTLGAGLRRARSGQTW